MEALSQPEENPYQSLHILLNNEDFYQRLIELPKVENGEIELEKMLENDTDEIEKKEYSSDIFSASLVNKLQEILYNFCVSTDSAEYCDIELLDELTSEQYELSKEESVAIFQEEAEYYITLKEKNGNALNELTSFGTSSHAAGKVIKY